MIGVEVASVMLAVAGLPAPVNAGGWITVGDYPVEAFNAGQEGATAVRLDVRPDGRVSDCQVTKSSGAPALDTATCGLLFVRARFTPATDASGDPVAGTYTTRISWRLPTVANAPRPATATPTEYKGPLQQNVTGAAVLHVEGDGLIARCEAMDRVYANVMAPPEICGLFPAGTRFSPPVVRGGKPMRRKVTVHLDIDSVVVR